MAMTDEEKEARRVARAVARAEEAEAYAREIDKRAAAMVLAKRAEILERLAVKNEQVGKHAGADNKRAKAARLLRVARFLYDHTQRNAPTPPA